MLGSYITLLERFGTCSVIMPYYSPTHKSFLLLSQLNSKTRKMLDEFYEGFLNCMIENLTCLESDDEEMLFLPCDLFKHTFYLNLQSRVDSFLKFIKNIDDQVGFYFKDHFMHKRLCIDSIFITTKIAKILYPSLELLKRTEVINCTTYLE